MPEMHVNYMNLKIISISFIFLFLSTNTSLANNKYFQCLEKITKVRSGNSSVFFVGKEHGYSFIKMHDYSDNPIVSIHFKSTNSNNKASVLILKKNTINTSLGFDLNYQTSKDNNNLEVTYNFIKVNDTYAFSKKKFWWSKKDGGDNPDTHDYNSSSRCKKINKEKYLNLIDSKKITNIQSYKWAAISKHPKSNKEFIATELSTKQKAINLAMKKCYKYVSNYLDKIGYNDCYLLKVSDNNSINNFNKVEKKSNPENNKDTTGIRPFALSWEGIDELIIGKLSFNEKDLIGKINFTLPTDGTKCFGSYALSTIKGTWSVICEKDNINASGTLKWNDQDGSVSGIGKDEKDNIVKFKVAGAN